MLAKTRARVSSSSVGAMEFLSTYGLYIFLGIAAVLAVFVILWAVGVFTPGDRLTTTSASTSQLATGTDERTIAKATVEQIQKDLAPVNKRLDSLETGMNGLRADVGKIQSDMKSVQTGQAAIQNRKLDLNLLMKYMDELDKPAGKPLSRLEGLPTPFPQSSAA
jgi:septal ring factor EnvC (AmiA/AmiB activator)